MFPDNLALLQTQTRQSVQICDVNVVIVSTKKSNYNLHSGYSGYSYCFYAFDEVVLRYKPIEGSPRA